MDSHIIKAIVLVFLALVLYQDIKNRTVHFLLFVAIFVMGLFYHLFYSLLLWTDLLKITAFLCLNIAGLFIYYSIKNKTLYNPVDKGIGLGDVVFFLAVAPFFAFKNYMIFFISGLVISIVLFGLAQLFKKKPKTIPLAGYLSFYLSAIFIVEICMSKTILTGG